MRTPNYSVAEDHDSEPKSAQKQSLHGPEGDLASANLDKLRGEWRRLYRCEPPRISRELLIRGIAYRRQELEHGGLGKTTRRKLKTLAKMFRTTGRVAPDPGLALKPGARLVREWHGRTHMHSAKLAPPLFFPRSTKGGRSCPPCMTTADIPAGPWTALPCNGFSPILPTPRLTWLSSIRSTA